MEYPEDGHISVIGERWLYPIVKLLEELNKYEFGARNDVQVSAIENGYSVAIIISAVAMVESYIHRMICIINDERKVGNKNDVKDKALTRKYFRTFFSDPDIVKKLEELWAIRDVISHNHIIGTKVTWNSDGILTPVDCPEKVNEFYGDNNYKKVINTETMTSTLLGLNLMPTKIGKDDALKVIINSYEILKFIEDVNKNHCDVSHLKIKYDSKRLTYPDFIKTLKLL